MQLVAYVPGSQQLAQLPAAAGWPHSGTAIGLGYAETGAWTWLIVDDDGQVAGECGVKGPPTPDGVVEIGYGLAGPRRGRGLGRQAVAAMVAELRAQPSVRVIEAHVVLDNLPSRRVLERLGFEVVDVQMDEAVYRLVV